MTVYISDNLDYPRYVMDIKNEHPDWTDDLNPPVGWNLVLEVDPPRISPGEKIIEDKPLKINGVWTQRFFVAELTSSDIEKIDLMLNAINNKNRHM
jgi:hypothetical protein